MSITNIILIEPKAPGRHVYSMIKMPRLGLPLLATGLNQRGYKARFIYGNSFTITAAELLKADLIGISTTTSTCQEAYKIARFARQKGIPVVLGGVHASFMPQEAIACCDYVCCGEADHSFGQLIDCLNRGEEPDRVPGIYYYRDRQLVANPWPPYPEMHDLPALDTQILEALGLGCYPVMTSRGCPYDCTFCSVTQMFGHRHRYQGLEQVLQGITPYTGKKVFFCDDNFTARPGHSKMLLREMIKKRILPAWWGAQVRVDTARDEELLGLMRESNCRYVYVGMESVNPRALESFNKRQNVQDIEHCIKTFHRYGIMVHGMFVLGGDEDDVNTIYDTVDFTIASGLDTVQYMTLVPLPGTPIYQELAGQGRLLHQDWRYYDGHHVVFRPRRMEPWELQDEALKAYRRFYAPLRLSRGLKGKRHGAILYRAAGYYLSRLFSRESQSYSQYLRFLARPLEVRPSIELSEKLRVLVKIGRIKKVKSLNFEIKEQMNVLQVELKGWLNQKALRKFLITFRKVAEKSYQDLVINIGQLSFASDDICKTFIKELNKMASRIKEVQVTPDLRASIVNLIEKDNLALPDFEF